jgi:hypothetical protein
MEFTNALAILIIVLVVQLAKKAEEKLLNRLGERSKDIVYPILAGVLVFLGYLFGLVDVNNLGDLLPLLVAPQGLYIVLKKLFGKQG